MKEKSCFNCILRPACKYFLATHDIPFDTLSIEYHKNHRNLYRSIATICAEYREAENEES